MSPPTPQRMLEQEGTSWRAEVDAARRERAARLQAGGIDKASVAARLG